MMDTLICIIMVIISQCVHVSNIMIYTRNIFNFITHYISIMLVKIHMQKSLYLKSIDKMIPFNALQ